MAELKEIKLVPCPDCGNNYAEMKIYGDSSYIYVGESETEDGYKTVIAEDGYIIECKECGYEDAEPCTW